MKIFQGVIVPMVTPVNEDHTVDRESVLKIVDNLVVNECAPFVLGTTGEATSFTSSQKLELVKRTIDATNGRMKVFAGISSTSLYDSIKLANAYQDMGVDVAVTTLPYYYPIGESEMLRFFTQLADEIKIPLMIYNMPAMVGASIPLDIADELSHHPNIVGMKDSERDIDRIYASIDLWKKRIDFSFYLGWAAKSAAAVLRGADGIVPSTGNFIPKQFKDLYNAAVKGNVSEAKRLQKVTDEISLIYQKDRKLNTSLPALKVLMEELGLCKSHVIPPLYNIVQDEQILLKAQIREALLHLE